MSWIDVVILAVIALSAVLSLWRGFVKEALSLASWIVAIWVAVVFFEPLAGMLSGWISSATARKVTAFVALFLCTLILGAVLSQLAGQLVRRTGLTGTDRALGVVFGAGRGVLIIALLVLLAGFTTIPQEAWWRESRLLVHFQDLAIWLRSFLPPDIKESIQFG